MSIDYDLGGQLLPLHDDAVASLSIWQKKPDWLCELTVKNEDCDVLGHTNNVRYIRWLEALAWQHSAALGLDWEAYQRHNRAMIARHHDIYYLRATVPGDRLWLATWRESCDGRIRFRRGYQIVISNGEAAEIALKGYTEWVCVRVDNGKPTRMPSEFAKAYTP